MGKTLEDTGSSPLSELAELAEELSPVAARDAARAAAATRRLQLARVISDVCNPQWLGIPIFGLVAVRSAATLAEGLAWWLACLALLVVPGRVFLVRRMRSRKVTDREVSVRSQRTPVYLFGISLLIFAMVVMVVFDAPRPLIAALAGILLASALGMLVNLRWKISVHAGTIGACAVILTVLFGAIWLVVLVPIVAA
jgi:hypothetical protein